LAPTLFAGLWELLYPTRCAGCDLPGTLLCEACQAALPRIAPAGACPRCGAPYGWLVCTECWDRDLAFEAGVSAGSLEHPLARVVTLFKDGGERRLASLMAGLLMDAVGPWQGWPDAISYIPATAKARRRRGFDHAAEIAGELAALLDVPLTSALGRERARDQRELGRAERFANARGTFVANGVQLPPHVLLVDDVLTTGATLDAAAAALKGAGAVEVRVATVARAW
jgi:predicted amidophosphoribosyltransferase